MSSSAPAGSGDGGDKPRGFSKFIRRASTFLRRDKSKGQSKSGPSALTPSQASGAQARSSSAPLVSTSAVAPAAVAIGATTAPTTVAATQPADTKEAPASTKPTAGSTALDSNKILEEKARALFAKYGLTLEPGEWTPPVKDNAVRVEKRCRVRIHRDCHRCHNTFGAERVCSNCQHTRCKKCPKFPGARSKESKDKAVAARALVGDNGTGTKAPSAATMKQRRDPIQRVRRICHKCEAAFGARASRCSNCKHLLCPQCARDPPGFGALFSGGTGTQPPPRREYRPITMRVRWRCHACQKTFMELETKCAQCSHEKCVECPRDPPIEGIPPLDPVAVKTVEERLKNMDISPQASAA